MRPENIRKIPKYIIEKIQKSDKKSYPAQDGVLRFYSYLTTIRKELVKITVAVRNYKKQWYCKQVAVHGVISNKCRVKDFEYRYFGGGFRVGWYNEGLTKRRSFYDDGIWYEADSKYFNVWSRTVNPEYVARFPEFKYSAYEHYKGYCIIEYLKLYKKYPQTEYLLKLGLHNIHDSIQVLKRIAKDKTFCKWLISNRAEISAPHYYIGTIMQAYKTGKPIDIIQKFEEHKKRLAHESRLKPIRELFKGKDLERFFSYLDEQSTDPYSYLDYLNACNYLGLDMTVSKNRYPHNFKRWHDVRIDEYHTAKADADEKERAELYDKFKEVAEKYMELQNCKKTDYAVFIARSPKELMFEGDTLHHCVGRMGYDQKMIREETLIFFVRDTERPDIPFVTIEYSIKSKKVLQCYGNESERPDEKVIQYVNKVWLPYANKTIKKIAA